MYRFAWKFDQPIEGNALMDEGLTEQAVVREHGVVVCFLHTLACLTAALWMKAEGLGGRLVAIRKDGPLGFLRGEGEDTQVLLYGAYNSEPNWISKPSFMAIEDSVRWERPYVPHYDIDVVKYAIMYKNWIHHKAAMIMAGYNTRCGKSKPTALQEYIGMRHVWQRGTHLKKRVYARPGSKAQALAEDSPFMGAYLHFFKKEYTGPKWVRRTLLDLPWSGNAAEKIEALGPDLAADLRLLAVPQEVLWGPVVYLATWIRDPKRKCSTTLIARCRDMGEYGLDLDKPGNRKTLKGLTDQVQDLEEVVAARHMEDMLRHEPKPDRHVGIETERAVVGGYKFVPLDTPRLVIGEGLSMKHCVGGYLAKVEAEMITLWGVSNDTERATLEVDAGGLNQLLGYRNSAPSQAMRAAAVVFSKEARNVIHEEDDNEPLF